MHTRTLALCAALGLCLSPAVAIGQTATSDPQAFAEAAASSNMFEIESSELALERATNDDVRAFAEQMVADHTLAGENMKVAAEADGIEPPAAMMAKEQAKLEELQSSEGEAFDEAYLAAQTGAHEEAVALFEAFSTQEEESALRDFAAETLPTLQTHQTGVHGLSGSQ